MNSENIIQKLWSYCRVLLADGMHFSDYVEQLIYLLLLKIADERTQALYNQISIATRGLSPVSALHTTQVDCGYSEGHKPTAA